MFPSLAEDEVLLTAGRVIGGRLVGIRGYIILGAIVFVMMLGGVVYNVCSSRQEPSTQTCGRGARSGARAAYRRSEAGHGRPLLR